MISAQLGLFFFNSFSFAEKVNTLYHEKNQGCGDIYEQTLESIAWKKMIGLEMSSCGNQ